MRQYSCGAECKTKNPQVGIFLDVISWEYLIPIFVIEVNGQYWTGLGSEHDSILVVTIWVYHIGEVLVIHLKYAWSNHNTRLRANAGGTVNHNTTDIAFFANSLRVVFGKVFGDFYFFVHIKHLSTSILKFDAFVKVHLFKQMWYTLGVNFESFFMPKKTKNRKYIFVVGGVLSGVGKGVTSASIGAILQSKGFRVTSLKADPYVNVDAGTMNPTEHGEVFVTHDGDETDQDMGNYERFLNIEIGSSNYMTTGRVYQTVIDNERAMKYKGKCVQVVPHIPEEIIRRIKGATHEHDADITIIEIGGTVGEYENILFLEAARMMKLESPNSVAFVLVSYLPIPAHIGEMKTKPTQHAARALNSSGINPDFVIARSSEPLDKPRREKLALFCGVSKDHCVSAPDAKSIYFVPELLEQDNIGNKILKVLGVKSRPSHLEQWKKLTEKITHPKKSVRIAVVGKYFGTGDYTLADSYISVIEAIKHAAWFHAATPELEWIDSEEFENNPKQVSKLAEFDGVIVPGGFGTRGIEGIIATIRYVRENKIPYLGLCYGMQLACVEFARHVMKKSQAHTTEVNEKTPDPIIHINPRQADNVKHNRYGGTMRLGSYRCVLKKGSLSQRAFGTSEVVERHRHRYEFNNAYLEAMDEAGLRVVGINPEADLVEMVELEEHPFFVGTQAHPEFRSRPHTPHPLFREFVKVALKGKS